MGNWKFRTVLRSLLIGCIVLFATHLGFARGGNVLKTQGLINPGGDPKAGYLIINEIRVYIDKTTRVMDHRGTPILLTELQPKKWVYMEIVQDQNKKKIRANKIYLLPRYINPEERKKFPFMN
jgi:hypothetical protein